MTDEEIQLENKVRDLARKVVENGRHLGGLQAARAALQEAESRAEIACRESERALKEYLPRDGTGVTIDTKWYGTYTAFISQENFGLQIVRLTSVG
jgi:hypothetical protein